MTIDGWEQQLFNEIASLQMKLADKQSQLQEIQKQKRKYGKI